MAELRAAELRAAELRALQFERVAAVELALFA